MRPQTNGLVERFNGRIEDVLQSHHFHNGEDLEQTILRYVRLYNGQLPQSVLKDRTPVDALKDWQRQRPELFRKRVYKHPGGGDSKPCWFALCSDWSVRYAEASAVPGDTPCPASIRPNSAACLPV